MRPAHPPKSANGQHTHNLPKIKIMSVFHNTLKSFYTFGRALTGLLLVQHIILVNKTLTIYYAYNLFMNSSLQYNFLKFKPKGTKFQFIRVPDADFKVMVSTRDTAARRRKLMNAKMKQLGPVGECPNPLFHHCICIASVSVHIHMNSLSYFPSEAALMIAVSPA